MNRTRRVNLTIDEDLYWQWKKYKNRLNASYLFQEALLQELTMLEMLDNGCLSRNEKGTGNE